MTGLPGAVGEIGADVDSDGVHHNGGDDLVDLQLHLQHTGDPGIEATDGHRAQCRRHNRQRRRSVLQKNTDVGGNDGTQVKLALAAHVEDTDSGTQSAGKARQIQHHGIFDGVAELALFEGRGKELTDAFTARGALHQLRVGHQGIMAGDQHDSRPHQQRQHHRSEQGQEVAPVDFTFHGPPPFCRRSCNSRYPPWRWFRLRNGR